MIERLRLHAALMLAPEVAPAVRELLTEASVLMAAAADELERLEVPVPMLLFCPRCQVQHVDRAEPESGWTNPPHATHTCAACGHLWRPSNFNTAGVSSLPALEPKHYGRIAAAWPRATIRVPPAGCKAISFRISVNCSSWACDCGASNISPQCRRSSR